MTNNTTHYFILEIWSEGQKKKKTHGILREDATEGCIERYYYGCHCPRMSN